MNTLETAVSSGPVAPDERVALFDVLRGFALFGILLANFGSAPGDLLPGLDALMHTGLDLLVWNSFYPLYSFLFGLGFAIQLSRARDAGAIHRYLRRLLGLFLIGAAHAILIWDGDILVPYAVFGLWLIPFHFLPDRALLVAILLVLVVEVVGAPFTSPPPAGPAAPAISAETQLTSGVRAEERTLMEGRLRAVEDEGGGLREHLSFRWQRFARNVTNLLTWPRVLGGDILLMFLVGMLAGRRRLLHEAARHRRNLVWVLSLMLLLVILGNVYERVDPDWRAAFGTLAWLLANHGLAIVYIAGIGLLLTGAGRWSRWLGWLAPAGRMGLTNYLAQSLVMTLLFYSYGLDLPEWGTTIRIAIHAIFFFLVQVPLSHWWLARYRFGPAEWLWRSLTYGTPQPMRIRSGPPLARAAGGLA